jgi:hypothetical protein
MTKSIKITVITIGLLSIGACLFSFYKGTQDEVSYFAFFIGVALIGTTLFTKTINKT